MWSGSSSNVCVIARKLFDRERALDRRELPQVNLRVNAGNRETHVGQLFRRAWRESAPAAIATRIDRRYRRLVIFRAVKVNYEPLPSDDNVAIFSNNVRPRLCIVGIIVILWLLSRDPNHDDEENKAQQKPTMNEAACFHVLSLS